MNYESHKYPIIIQVDFFQNFKHLYEILSTENIL